MVVAAPPFSIESALDAYVADESEDRPPDGKWHPSSMFACERKAIYQVRGVPEDEPISPRLRRIFFLGTNFHQITQTAVTAALTREGRSIKAAYHEVGIKVPLLNIDGHGDSLVQFEDGTWELEEYKSIAEWGFKSVKRDGPKDEHKKQALAYAYCLARYPWTSEFVPEYEYLCPNCNTPWSCNGPHIPEPEVPVVHPPLGAGNLRIRITYLEKASMDTSEWLIEPTREWDEEFEAYLAKLQRYKQDGGALPLRLPDKTKYPCSYCGFRVRCWDEDTEGVQL